MSKDINIQPTPAEALPDWAIRIRKRNLISRLLSTIGNNFEGRSRWLAAALTATAVGALSILGNEGPKDNQTTLTPDGSKLVAPQDPQQLNPETKSIEDAIKAEASKQPEPITTIVDRIQAVVNHMSAYLDKLGGAKVIEKFNKSWEVLPVSDPLQIVLQADPINIRDFPDTNVGRLIPDPKQVDGYFYKVLRANPNKKPIPGFFQEFIFIKNPDTTELESIWAVLDLRKNPSDIKRENMEVFAVYHLGEWLTSFISEGISLQGKDIFGSYLDNRNSRIIIQKTTEDGAYIYNNGIVGANPYDIAWANSIPSRTRR